MKKLFASAGLSMALAASFADAGWGGFKRPSWSKPKKPDVVKKAQKTSASVAKKTGKAVTTGVNHVKRAVKGHVRITIDNDSDTIMNVRMGTERLEIPEGKDGVLRKGNIGDNVEIFVDGKKEYSTILLQNHIDLEWNGKSLDRE